MVSKLTTVVACVIPVDVVAVVSVPSVVGNVFSVEICGVVWMLVWVGNSVSGVNAVVNGLVLDVVDATFNVVTLGR